VNQPTFWDARIESAAPAADRPRLSRQCLTILERIAAGPVTNRELAGIAMQYNARILELRRAGYDIRKVSQDHDTGVAVYELVEVA
jgi:hypothetical protein